MSTIVSKTTYATPDGRTFDSLAAAEAHQQYLSNREVVEAYIAHFDVKSPQAGALRRHLPAFASFWASYVPGTFDLAAFDAAAKAAADAKAEAAKAAAGTPAGIPAEPTTR